MLDTKNWLKGVTTAWTVSVSGQTAFAVPGENLEYFDASETCTEHLLSVVNYLNEIAKLEGKSVEIRWETDKKVWLIYEDLVQRMWCQGEDMHVDYPEKTK